MIALETNIQSAMTGLDGALERVAKLGRRSAADIVRRAGLDIMLGSRGASGGAAFDGLYQAFSKIAPREGTATAEAQSRGWTVKKDSDTTRLAASRADKLLGGDASGVFRIGTGTRGRVFAPQRVQIGTRGRAALKIRAVTARRGKGKTALWRQSTREQARASGYRVLNRQALIAAWTVALREAGRGSLAVQFVPRLARRSLLRRNQTGTFKATSRDGSMRGKVDVDTREDGTGSRYVRITGFRDIPSKHRGIVARVINNVRMDREEYLLAREARKYVREARTR